MINLTEQQLNYFNRTILASVRDSLEVAEIFKTIPKHCFFPTVDDAIAVISHFRYLFLFLFP